MDGTLGSTKCMEAYERHLNALDDLAKAKYLFGQHERLEVIKKERKLHKIEKERIWKLHSKKIRSTSNVVDKYFDSLSD